MRLSICRAMCLLGRTAIDKAISVKADSLYLLRQAPSQPVKSPNIVSKRSSRSNRWKPILVELVFPARLDLCCQPEPFGENTVSGLRKAKKAKRPRPLPLWRMYTVFGSAYTDLGSLILDLGFQILKFELQNQDFNVWLEITVTSWPIFAWE